MKEIQNQQNSKIYKICSICFKSILDLNLNYIKNSKQKEKIKENFKNIQPTEFIKICNCKNLQKDINNDNNLYVHKYCILLKIIYQFEIKCEKCNSYYNLQINKNVDLKKKIYLYIIFLFIYIVHLVIYLLSIMILFRGVISNKTINLKKYKCIIFFLIIILLIINSYIFYFSIINNMSQYKRIYNYTINILNVNNSNLTNKYYELIYDYYKWFYDKSKKILLIYKHKNYLVNKINYNFNKEIKIFIKENNKEYKRVKKYEDKISKNHNTSKISLNINNNTNSPYNNLNNLLTFENAQNNKNNEKDIANPLDNIILNKKPEVKIENNINMNNDLFDLYSDRTDNNNNNNEENQNNDNKNEIKKNIIDMTSINKFKKDYINININPIQTNNINININFNDLNKIKEIPFNNENNELVFNPTKLHESNGKTALIPKKKNMMNNIIDDNTYKNYIKQRKQIKSIKLKQKDIKINDDNKIIGNIEENEEIDFSEFEKGKMDSRISRGTKGDIIFLFKSIGANDLFRTKKSYKEVPLNISNPTDSVMYEDNNNRFSLKNNIITKNANFSNSNLCRFSIK